MPTQKKTVRANYAPDHLLKILGEHLIGSKIGCYNGKSEVSFQVHLGDPDSKGVREVTNIRVEATVDVY